MAGTSRNQYRVYPLTLAAGEGVHLAGVGSYFQCLAATAAFKIGMDDGPVHKIDSGFGWEGRNAETFETLRLENTSGAPNVIELAVGLGRFRDSRLSVSGTINANIVSGLVDTREVRFGWQVAGQVTVPANGSVAIPASDVSARGILFSNTHPVYAVNVIANLLGRGPVLWPSSTLYLPAEKWTASSALYVYNPNSGPVVVTNAKKWAL